LRYLIQPFLGGGVGKCFMPATLPARAGRASGLCGTLRRAMLRSDRPTH